MICALYETIRSLHQNWHGNSEKSAVGQCDIYVVMTEEPEEIPMLVSNAAARIAELYVRLIIAELTLV